MQDPLTCPECRRMRSECQRLGVEYAVAKASLAAAAVATWLPEYNRLKVAADDALIESELALWELALHGDWHARPESIALHRFVASHIARA